MAPGRLAPSVSSRMCWSMVSRRMSSDRERTGHRPRDVPQAPRFKPHAPSLQLVALEPAVERAARQAQRPRRVADVAESGHSFLYEECLDLFQTHIFEAAGATTVDPKPEILRAHGVPAGHQHRPLDRVIQFADVA